MSEITNAPEMLGGRVKTLHPAVHAGKLNLIAVLNMTGENNVIKTEMNYHNLALSELSVWLSMSNSL